MLHLRYLSFLMLAGAVGCSGSDSGTKTTPPDPEPDATSAGYEALTRGNADAVPGVITDLDGALEKDPKHGRANFYAATMRFWQIGENLVPLTDYPVVGRAVLDHFEQAYESTPDDARIPAFSGLAHTFLGGLLKDDAAVDLGNQLLQEGIDRMPTYGHFLRALSTGSLPAKHPDFASTLDHMLSDAEACKWESDGEGGYVYPNEDLQYPYRVCNNEGIVPHVWEGFLTAWGDFALKGGLGADKARALYGSAKSSPTYDSWPYADTLQKRIDDADATAALYADEDPANDPGVWTLSGHICTGCHQKER